MDTFDGQVLPGARSSTSNADTTGEVATGVSRAVFTSDQTQYPSLTVTDINGARYRSTLLDSSQTTEYLLWAVTSGPLVVAPGTIYSSATVTVPTGTTTTGIYKDGTARVVITDDGGSSIAAITTLTYTLGGTTTPVPVVPGDYTFNPLSGTITFTAGLIASASRGDSFSATYEIDGARFNWTRNDPTGTRFGWNGAHRKWEPYKGGAVKNLDRLASSGRYVLSPVPTTALGQQLPGSDTVGQFAMLRLGATPDESSYPVVYRTPGPPFSGVLVVTDDLATTAYNFGSTTPPLAGVVGHTSGRIAWNPTFVSAHDGETLWYSPRDFNALSTGIVGSILDTLYIAPVPAPFETPILRIGQRAPLAVLPVENETDLGTLVVPSYYVGLALSTGRLKLNAADIALADPTDPGFDPLYLGVNLRYDGSALNSIPQPVQAPVQLVLVGNDLYIPPAVGLPGTGVSGILNVPDGTGNTPDPSLPVSPRPVASGLVERHTPGFGDAFLFSTAGRVANLVTVNFDNDLPIDIYAMPLDTAYVSLDTGKVAIGYALSQVFTGLPVYFVQALVTPSLYPDAPRIFSRIRDSFTTTTPVDFPFRVDGVNYLLNVPAGTFTADLIATALGATLGAGGTSGVIGGHVYIASNLSNGTVSVGFDEDGCRVLGFPPGWYVSDPATGSKSATDPNWLPDTGVSYGLYRSPNNLDGSQTAPDVRATYRVEDTTLSDSVQGVPYQLLNYPPREDIAGYDNGIFFALSGVSTPSAPVQVTTTLQPWTDVVYQFDQSRFGWLSPFSFGGQVQEPLSSLDLGAPGVVPETFYSAMNGSMLVSRTGGAAQSLVLDTDFLVPEGSGTALLIDRIGELKQTGYRGSITGSTLTDTSTTIVASAGDRLKVVSTQSAGSYTVQSSTATTIVVSPAFPTASTSNVSWELYQGVAPGAINPAVLGDVEYQDFNHLPTEPYEVRLLTGLGVAGGAISSVDLPTANSGRTLAVRYSQTGTDIPLTLLTSTILGSIANGVLGVPTTGDRFTTGSFSITVGTRTFVNSVDLVPVAVFTGTAGIIEYMTAAGVTPGRLNFGSTILSDYATATVVYRQEPLPVSDIPTGNAELSPFTGAVRLSLVDITAHTGDTVYFVDLQTQDSVYLNPILGAFTFKRPIEARQLVEATYTRAVPDSGALYLVQGQPVTVTEFLPVYIRRETATRDTPQVYSFNPAGRTVDTDVAPSVYVGTKMVSYGTPTGVTVTFSNNTLSLVDPVADSTVVVLISYAVFEATGGETTYTVSQGPVWRPPFQLAANQATFTLLTDRTTDMVPGKALRIGNYLTYLRAASYNATTDVTTVTVFPVPVKSVGSLAPSEPPTSLLTDRLICPVIDPAGSSPVPTTADTGFLPRLTTAYGLSSVPRFQKVTKGQSIIRFEGDLTRYAVAGHTLEMFGYPFIISKGELIDGTYTDISLGSAAPVELSWTSGMSQDLVRISVRPIYPENPIVFIGAGAFVSTEPYEVVIFDGTTPGVTLVEGRDYQLDTRAGTLNLLQPRTSGLPANSSLRFYRTVQMTLAPFIYQGIVQYPRVSASAGFIDPPSDINGRLGSVLTATYTFDSPDSFFARSVPLPTYITETAASIVRGVTASATGNNPSVGGTSRTPPASGGRAGLISERQDLVSRDRVTRSFLFWYNGIVSSFEQVLENLDGNPVGDRDGKLRLWMGRNDPWTPPGYEDDITGVVNAHNVWSEVWNGYCTNPVSLIGTDPIINPITATLDVNGNPVGTALSSSALDRLMERQRTAIKNDVDDVVLVGLRNTTRSLAGIIRFQVTSYGTYRGLSEASAFSRLFPERTDAFTTTDPGIGYDPSTGDDGVYSYGKLVLDPFGDPPAIGFERTSGKAIARLANPVRGNITSVLGATITDRLARARLISFSPTGYVGIPPARPMFIATVLPLDQFPLTPTGAPDTARFISVSLATTDLPDLATGDTTLHTPPFVAGDQLALGTPDGTIYGLGYAGTVLSVGGQDIYAGVFVDAIVQGCYVTLKTYNAAGAFIPITFGNVADLVRLLTPDSGLPLTTVDQGDTLFVVPTTGAVLVGVSDPPTTTQLAAYANSLPAYRVGTDVGIDGRTGELVDATLPSFGDPNLFGLKELTGQKPPPPMQTLQARVAFQNGDTAPSNIPALQGESKLDSGDYSLPYYGITPTELSVLGTLFPLGLAVASGDAVNPPDNPPAAGYPVYVLEATYPDEILDNQGSLDILPAAPSVLVTSVQMNPVYTAHSGVKPLEAYDLVYVQEGTGGLPGGATGIHTVGAVSFVAPTSSWIEPPRFVSRSNTLGRFIGNVFNTQVYIEADPVLPQPHASGLAVMEDTTVPGVVTTVFELINVLPANIVFDDGAGGGALFPPVGGLNTWFTTAIKNTLLRVKIMDATGTFVPGANVILNLDVTNADITLCGFDVSGDNGATFIAGVHSARFHTQRFVVTTTAQFFDFAAYGVVPTPPPGITALDPSDFAFDLETPGSYATLIETDRLTVEFPVDPRSARPRGTLNPGGESVQCELETLGGDIYLTQLALPPTSAIATVNHVNMVNDGVPFTFLPRAFAPYTLTPYQVGVFSGGIGYLKVMAFEGWQNAAFAGTDITFSAAPSARQNDTEAILTTISYSDRIDNPSVTHTAKWGDNRFIVAEGSEFKGYIGNVLPGDILVVKSTNESPIFAAAVLNGKAGTHLVRGVIAPDTGLCEEKQVSLTTPDPAGDYNDWLPFEFPTVVNVDVNTLTVTDIPILPVTQDWMGAPTAQVYQFPAAGRVYVIVYEPGLDSTNGALFATSIISADYASLDPVNMEFQTLSNYTDGIGNPIAGAAFVAMAAVGSMVSGMTLLPVNPHGTGIPENFPGYCNTNLAWGPLALFGFRTLAVSRGLAALAYTANTTAISGALDPVGPATSTVYIHEKIRQTSDVFLPLETPVYHEIPGVITTGLTNADWDLLHTPAGAVFVPAGARCFLPGDTWVAGYSAAAGIFVEPSFPCTANNLAGAGVNVVDANNSLTVTTVGVRRLTDYITVAPGVGEAYIENTEIEVRRPRRFHDLGNTFGTGLQALRYNYEIRRGIVSSVTDSGGYGLLTATPVNGEVPPVASAGGTATQVGDFTTKLVNVNPGDEVRFIDANGDITARADVVVVTGTLTITLSRKVVVAPGTRFEVYLKVPPVPHEQSNEELLGYATDTVLVNRSVDYVAQTGGQVPATRNVLVDTLNFPALEVAAGDIVLVDPAGKLTTPAGPATPVQWGRRPYGDDAVLARTGYTAGGPTRADDNRGYYKVAQGGVATNALTVQAMGGLAGNDGGDVTFGTPTTTEYAIYPTIHASGLTGTTEGQMDLRLTSLPVGTSYKTNWRSVGPFAYRVIRPTPLLSDATVELILAMRERMLSWAEEIRLVGSKYGTYFVFQRDAHIRDLGTTGDPESGLGLMSGAYLTGLVGHWALAPFTNVTDCLSILDRRFWGLDMRLDTLTPPYGPFIAVPYTDFAGNVGRPVLPDRIDAALDGEDRLRATRYSWLSLRVDRVRGTLGSIRRFDIELPRRQDEAEQALAAVQSVEKVLP